MRNAKIGKAIVSTLCLGANPFSGFSHQGPARDTEMKQFYTADRVKESLRQAEAAGINTVFARTDEHICRIIAEYWKAGGRIQWFAQVREESVDREAWRTWLKTAADIGATGGYIHGGLTDYWFAQKMYDRFHDAAKIFRETGLVFGYAGHNPLIHDWVRDNIECDFQMCCHYNPTDRSASPHHIGVGEKWNDSDRQRMLQTIATIQQINRPIVHYKVFAGGNKPILPAFELLQKVMRPNDVICAGMFTKDNPNMIQENVKLVEEYIG